LDDAWTALVGYQANGGDVDILLVGPKGTFAIELKHFNAVVSCNGDQWWKTDSGQRTPIENGRGRSPSHQLNANVKALRNYLEASQAFYCMRTIVVLSHSKSRIRSIVNPTVDFILTLNDWEGSGWFSQFPSYLTEARTSAIVGSITRSHEHWRNRRAPNEPLAFAAANDDEWFQTSETCGASIHRHRSFPNGRSTNAAPKYPLRSARPSENKGSAWMAGAFDHLTDKPKLLKPK
jgi:hypothetical protein